MGGGVKALPQARERLRAVERVGVDPDRVQRRLDLPGQLQARKRSRLVGFEGAPAAGLRERVEQLCLWVLSAGLMGDGHPPAGGDRRLV